jgi:hypothetical protein
MPESVRRAGVGRRRSYGNELWDFDGNGLMRYREASINDVPIEEQDRLIFGPAPNPSGRAVRAGISTRMTSCQIAWTASKSMPCFSRFEALLAGSNSNST